MSTDAGIEGFCIGGHMTYLTAAETDIVAAASFYGGGIAAPQGPGGQPSPIQRTNKIRGRVVIDAATDFKGYSADVTRTFPVNGKFSPEQSIIYSAVLAAQTAAAALVKPGAKMSDLIAAANAELWKGVVKAGLVDSVGATYEPTGGAQGGRNAGGRASQLSLFYFHGLSHGLGLDVHDPLYTEGGNLVVNSIFTIEPGLYVRPSTLDMVPDVPANTAFRERLKRVMAKYSGIGTRIEDDYVVTATGSICLSCGAPRSIAAVEAIMGRSAPKVKPK